MQIMTNNCCFYCTYELLSTAHKLKNDTSIINHKQNFISKTFGDK